MMDKHNNYLQEMTATADNRLSYSVIEPGIIAARFDWHILTGRAYTAYTMILTHQHAACVRLWSMHEYIKDTSKRLQWILYSNKSLKRGDTSRIVCLVYTKIYCSGPQRLIWGEKKEYCIPQRCGYILIWHVLMRLTLGNCFGLSV